MAKPSSAPDPSVLQALRTSVDVVAGLVESIPEERLDLRRKPHFWTIRQHVLHLAEVQPMLFHRIERFRDEESPNFTPYLPSDDEEAEAKPAQEISVETAIEELRRWREKQLELIETLPATVWERQAVHPEFDLYTALILVRHIAMHDHWHLYRIEELWITRDAYLTELA